MFFGRPFENIALPYVGHSLKTLGGIPSLSIVVENNLLSLKYLGRYEAFITSQARSLELIEFDKLKEIIALDIVMREAQEEYGAQMDAFMLPAVEAYRKNNVTRAKLIMERGLEGMLPLVSRSEVKHRLAGIMILMSAQMSSVLCIKKHMVQHYLKSNIDAVKTRLDQKLKPGLIEAAKYQLTHDEKDLQSPSPHVEKLIVNLIGNARRESAFNMTGATITTRGTSVYLVFRKTLSCPDKISLSEHVSGRFDEIEKMVRTLNEKIYDRVSYLVLSDVDKMAVKKAIDSGITVEMARTAMKSSLHSLSGRSELAA